MYTSKRPRSVPKRDLNKDLKETCSATKTATRTGYEEPSAKRFMPNPSAIITTTPLVFVLSAEKPPRHRPLRARPRRRSPWSTSEPRGVQRVMYRMSGARVCRGLAPARGSQACMPRRWLHGVLNCFGIPKQLSTGKELLHSHGLRPLGRIICAVEGPYHPLSR